MRGVRDYVLGQAMNQNQAYLSTVDHVVNRGPWFFVSHLEYRTTLFEDEREVESVILSVMMEMAAGSRRAQLNDDDQANVRVVDRRERCH